MTFEPFRSIVLSGQVPKLHRPDAETDREPATNETAPPRPAGSTIVERPGIGPESDTGSHPARPESLHHHTRDEDLEEIVRPPSTVVTKEWVFAETQSEVDSALGHEGPREATISPAKMPPPRSAPPPPIQPRADQVPAVPDLHMNPLPAHGIRQETTGSVPSLHEGVSSSAPRQFVVAYAGSLIGTYRGEAPAGNRSIFENVARQLAVRICAFGHDLLMMRS